MENDSIRWGIIGCGDVTEVKSGPAFNKVPGSRLVAVMRRNGAKAKDYAQRHGVGKWYDDAAALINDPEVNAVYVATPPQQHEEYTLRALAAGKPVYVEKPMALNAAAAQRMMQAAADTGVKLAVAHYRRAQPLFLKIRALLEQRAIGEVRLVNLRLLQPHQSDRIATTEVNWRLDPAVSGGGLFYDLAPHQLDLMVYFFGQPVQVAGHSLNVSGIYDVPDSTIGAVVFNDHILFNGTWNFAAPVQQDKCEIMGTKGSIRFSIFDRQPLVMTTGGTVQQIEFDPIPHVQQPMIEAVVRYFTGTGPNPCSAADGYTVMSMIDRMAQRTDR